MAGIKENLNQRKITFARIPNQKDKINLYRVNFETWIGIFSEIKDLLLISNKILMYIYLIKVNLFKVVSYSYYIH